MVLYSSPIISTKYAPLPAGNFGPKILEPRPYHCVGPNLVGSRTSRERAIVTRLSPRLCSGVRLGMPSSAVYPRAKRPYCREHHGNRLWFQLLFTKSRYHALGGAEERKTLNEELARTRVCTGT